MTILIVIISDKVEVKDDIVTFTTLQRSDEAIICLIWLVKLLKGDLLQIFINLENNA